MKLSFSFYVNMCAIALVLYFTACTQRQKENSTVEFPRALVEKSTNALEDKLLHYWNSFNFEDTTAVKDPNIGEQALVDFIALFSKVSDTISSQAVKKMLSKAKPYSNSFQFFTQQYERYLYNPNSPVRNDLYYEPVLEFLVDSIQLNDADKYRYGTLLKLVKKNKVGALAQDFKVELANGGKTDLHSVKSPFTLLFFYEPGCSHCEEAITVFRSTPALQNLVSQNTMKVLGVYTAGERAIWEGYQEKIPKNWLNGFDWDGQILTDALYDVKASPTIYLLDKDKRVVLKDTDLSQLTLFFSVK